MSIRVIIADDHRILREGLRVLIEQEPNVKVVGEADNGKTTIELVKKFKPHIVIMDISMPDLNGFDATTQIVRDYPDTRVIALSMFSDKQYVAKMIQSGASAYLRKDCFPEEIRQAMEAVLQGRIYLGPSISGTASGVVLTASDVSKFLVTSLLTPKERVVLQLIAEGKTTKYIATQLEMSEKTVEKHRQHIMTKLDLHSVAELTKYAIREGLTSLHP